MAPMRTQEGDSVPEPQLGSVDTVGGIVNCVNRGSSTGSRARIRQRKFQGTETPSKAQAKSYDGKSRLKEERCGFKNMEVECQIPRTIF